MTGCCSSEWQLVGGKWESEGGGGITHYPGVFPGNASGWITPGYSQQ